MESKEDYMPKKEVGLGDFAENEPDYSEVLKGMIGEKVSEKENPKESTGEAKKEVFTPERVKEIWDGLSKTEKNLIMASDRVFDAVLNNIGNKLGDEKTLIIRHLRKWIRSHDPLASLIETEQNN